MAGTIMRLVPVRLFDWSSYAASASNTIILTDYIDLSPWKEGQLIARAHNGTNITGTANAVVSLYGTDPADDDPSVSFLTASAIVASTITLDSTYNPAGTSAPFTLGLVQLNANFGLKGRLQIVLTQPNPAVTAKLVLSIDLVLKTDG